jgi:hypothetical protein
VPSQYSSDDEGFDALDLNDDDNKADIDVLSASLLQDAPILPQTQEVSDFRTPIVRDFRPPHLAYFEHHV